MKNGFIDADSLLESALYGLHEGSHADCVEFIKGISDEDDRSEMFSAYRSLYKLAGRENISTTKALAYEGKRNAEYLKRKFSQHNAPKDAAVFLNSLSNNLDKADTY